MGKHGFKERAVNEYHRRLLALAGFLIVVLPAWMILK